MSHSAQTRVVSNHLELYILLREHSDLAARTISPSRPLMFGQDGQSGWPVLPHV